MSAPSLLTVIVNYRTAQMTLRAAEAALREMAEVPGGIVIVDNDSRDGSFEAMTSAVAERGWNRDGRVRVLQSGQNGGFGAGNNTGIRSGLADGSAPDYVYLLNSDAFPDPGSIRRLLEHMQATPSTGLAGSFIHGPDGEPHNTAFRFPSIRGEIEAAARFGPISRAFARHIVAMPIPDETCTVDWVAGASLMIRRSMLDEIGLFDEGFFLYFEETDLCRRARNASWLTDYVRDSAVTHIGSVSTGMKKWDRIPGYWLDSRLRYFVKTHGAPYAAAATLAFLSGAMIWRMRRLLTGHPPLDPTHFLRDLTGHALRSAWRGLVGRGAGPQSGVSDRRKSAASPIGDHE